MNILFVNACVRGKGMSRTDRIARAFLGELMESNPECRIVEKNLSETMPEYLHAGNFWERENKLSGGNTDDKMFDPAREFASADGIVIAAPLWDFSFPAILRVYLESISVAGITFRYEEDRSVGLCKAKKMLYITSRGADFTVGPLSNMKHGENLLKTLAELYGIPEFDVVAAEGLDLFSVDVDSKISAAEENAKKCARAFAAS